jgi:hypothetical protein
MVQRASGVARHILRAGPGATLLCAAQGCLGPRAWRPRSDCQVDLRLKPGAIALDAVPIVAVLVHDNVVADFGVNVPAMFGGGCNDRTGMPIWIFEEKFDSRCRHE